jgi:GDP/UDP-N,N'-diacetylbacillosamine 2-epimerase (hydrolysing)
MKNKRKICVFSGKRGGLGAYFPLMRLIEKDPALELQILLGDMHVAKEFGGTVNEAKKFFPKAQIELIDMGAGRGSSALIRAENLGTCLNKVAGVLQRLKPDILMVHADRGEHLVVALAALNLGIPITHSQGGENSGNIDDVQRHAITKLSHIHFPETKKAAENIRRMGEESWRVHNVGSLYIDRIVKKMYTKTAIAKKKYGIGADENYFLVLLHPDTFESQVANYKAMKDTLAAVKSFGLKSLVVYPCSDPGYQGVIDAIEEAKNDKQFLVHKNIENLDFLGLMAGALAMVGNSSSAFVEAPYFKLPVVNIGKRQLGRDREENVIDVKPSVKDIKLGIEIALSDKKFKKNLKKCGWRLGDGRASEKVLKVLKTLPVNERLLRKKLVF